MTTGDPASLDRLHDLVVPPPVPLWPPAPGWYVVGALALVLAAALGFRAVRRWRANAYRRAALAELEALSPASPRTPVALAGLLKRTALAAVPREEVAGLAGAAWLRWLEAAGPFPASAAVRQALTEDVYRPGATPDVVALRAYARRWIRHHRIVPHRSRDREGKPARGGDGREHDLR